MTQQQPRAFLHPFCSIQTHQLHSLVVFIISFSLLVSLLQLFTSHHNRQFFFRIKRVAEILHSFSTAILTLHAVCCSSKFDVATCYISKRIFWFVVLCAMHMGSGLSKRLIVRKCVLNGSLWSCSKLRYNVGCSFLFLMSNKQFVCKIKIFVNKVQ